MSDLDWELFDKCSHHFWWDIFRKLWNYIISKTSNE